MKCGKLYAGVGESSWYDGCFGCRCGTYLICGMGLACHPGDRIDRMAKVAGQSVAGIDFAFGRLGMVGAFRNDTMLPHAKSPYFVGMLFEKMP